MGQLILVVLTCEVRDLMGKMSKSKTKLDQLLMVAMLTLAGTGTCFYLPNRNKNVESDCLSQDNKPGVCTKITNCQTLSSNIIFIKYTVALYPYTIHPFPSLTLLLITNFPQQITRIDISESESWL